MQTIEASKTEQVCRITVRLKDTIQGPGQTHVFQYGISAWTFHHAPYDNIPWFLCVKTVHGSYYFNLDSVLSYGIDGKEEGDDSCRRSLEL